MFYTSGKSNELGDIQKGIRPLTYEETPNLHISQKEMFCSGRALSSSDFILGQTPRLIYYLCYCAVITSFVAKLARQDRSDCYLFILAKLVFGGKQHSLLRIT